MTPALVKWPLRLALRARLGFYAVAHSLPLHLTTSNARLYIVAACTPPADASGQCAPYVQMILSYQSHFGCSQILTDCYVTETAQPQPHGLPPSVHSAELRSPRTTTSAASTSCFASDSDAQLAFKPAPHPPHDPALLWSWCRDLRMKIALCRILLRCPCRRLRLI
jgi:hypothetical protein